LNFPAFPFFVVIKTTPLLAPAAPYIPAADASFKTVISSILFGSIAAVE